MAARLQPLTEAVQVGQRYYVVDRRNVPVLELTAEEYAALGVEGAFAPSGIRVEDWRDGTYRAVGGVPDYDGLGRSALVPGEFLEQPHPTRGGILVCYRKRDDTVGLAVAPRVDSTWSRMGGLTITRAWSAETQFVAVAAGVLELAL